MKEVMTTQPITIEQFSTQFEEIEGQAEQLKAVVSRIKEIPWGKGRTCEEVLTKKCWNLYR